MARPACFTDPETWRKVHEALTQIMKEAEELGAHDIVIRAKVLIEDLNTWDPNEEVCYDEFFSRIRTLRSELQWWRNIRSSSYYRGLKRGHKQPRL